MLFYLEMVVIEIREVRVVDMNLLHLTYILYSLECFNFDKQITELLQKLLNLVESKLYNSSDFDDYEIVDTEVQVVYFLKKPKKFKKKH